MTKSKQGSKIILVKNDWLEGNMSLPDTSYLTSAGLEYSSIAKAYGKHININCMNRIEIFKEEMKKFLKEIQGNTNKWNK